jgi:hypothetical protein
VACRPFGNGEKADTPRVNVRPAPRVPAPGVPRTAFGVGALLQDHSLLLGRTVHAPAAHVLPFLLKAPRCAGAAGEPASDYRQGRAHDAEPVPSMG